MPGILSLPLPTLKRLPLYLELLRERGAEGEQWISSEAISRRLGLTAIQVRKDLGMTGAPASPKRGFRVAEATALIEGLLGHRLLTDVALIGASPRGEAACGDASLGRQGYRVAAVFDPSPERDADTLCGFKVLPLVELPGIARRLGVKLALLAVGESRFPGCARFAAESGIRGLVNISGEPIDPIDGLVIIQEDLGFQLASLSRELDLRAKSEA